MSNLSKSKNVYEDLKLTKNKIVFMKKKIDNNVSDKIEIINAKKHKRNKNINIV